MEKEERPFNLLEAPLESRLIKPGGLQQVNVSVGGEVGWESGGDVGSAIGGILSISENSMPRGPSGDVVYEYCAFIGGEEHVEKLVREGVEVGVMDCDPVFNLGNCQFEMGLYCIWSCFMRP